MLSYFEPNFIEKFHRESVLFKFWSLDYFRETKIRLLDAILKGNIFSLIFFVMIYVVLGVYRYGSSFVPKFLWESSLKWLGPSGPPSL